MGPLLTDRIIAINIICTESIIIIAILSYLFSNKELLDVALVYAMIAFLVIVVLSKCYIMPHHARPSKLHTIDKPVDSESETKAEDME